MTTPNLIALVALVVVLAALGALLWSRKTAGSEDDEGQAPPGPPSGDRPPAVSTSREHRDDGTVRFTVDGDHVDDVAALVSDIDRFTEGAMKLQQVTCREEGGLQLLGLTLLAGELRGTLEPSLGLDTAGLLPLLNGALAHGGSDRRLVVATDVDGPSLALAFVTRDEAEALIDDERITSADGFGPPDLPRTFATPPLGGPAGFVDGEPYTATLLAAEGTTVVAVRRGRVVVFRGGERRELEGVHSKADAVCIDGGEVVAATGTARTIGVWPADGVTPAHTTKVDVDMGRVIALDRRGGLLVVGVRSKKADQCWVVLLDADGGELARQVLPYGVLKVRCAPDGEHVAVALEGDGMRVLTRTGDEVVHHVEEGKPYALTWRRDSEEVACAFDGRGRTLRWSAGAGVQVAQHGVSALAYGPDGELARSFLDEVVMPDGRSVPVTRQVLELAWGDRLWGTGDHGWVTEVA